MHSSTYSSWQLTKDIFRLIAPYKKKFWFGIFIRFTSDLVWLYPAFALAELVSFLTTYQQGDSLELVWMLLGGWAILTLYHSPTHDLCKFFVYQVAEKAALDAQIQTIQHLFSLDIAWHEQENSGNKLKRIQKGAEGINKIIRLMVDNLVEIIVNFVAMLTIISFFDPVVTVLLIFFLIIFLTLSWQLTKKAALASHHVNVQQEDLQGTSFEAINNIQTVKVLDIGVSLLRIIQKTTEQLMKKIRYRIIRFRLRQFSLNICVHTFRLCMIGVISWGISEGKYEVGFLVLSYKYFDKIAESIEELAEVTNEFIIAKYGIWRMMDILNTPIQIENNKGKSIFPTDWKQITLNNVSFGYEGEEILKNISLDIKRGEKIGIVGPSGAGKSTLFKLLLKQHENYTGHIAFGETELKNIKKSSFAEHVAVVLQETELFNMSLEKNITIATTSKKKSTAILRKSLAVSHVTDFLKKLPQNTKTIIGEKGVKLSGGEKQRLGIARAVYKDPQILFLDEATSHLDIESEQKIQDSLHQFFQNITAVVIAHRLSTIKEMDRIVVLENGQIVEQGSFEKLMKQKGRFFELWKKQQL